MEKREILIDLLTTAKNLCEAMIQFNAAAWKYENAGLDEVEMNFLKTLKQSLDDVK